MNYVSGNSPGNLAAGETPTDATVQQRGRGTPLRLHSRNRADGEPAGTAADYVPTRLFARVRWMMIISAITTAVAIATVAGVVGFRIFNAAGIGGGSRARGVIMLPKGARIVSTVASGGRIVVTLDIGGATEIRTFDLKTLKQIGRLRFATEP